MIRFYSTKKAIFLKFYGVDVKPEYDNIEEKVVFYVDENQEKYNEISNMYRKLFIEDEDKEFLIDFNKYIKVERRLRNEIENIKKEADKNE